MIYMLQEERTQGSEGHDIHYRLEQALIDVKNSRKKEFEEAIKRWKEEDNALDAKQKASLLAVSFCLLLIPFLPSLFLKIVSSWRISLFRITSQSRKHVDQLEFVHLYCILQCVVWGNIYISLYLILQSIGSSIMELPIVFAGKVTRNLMF